MPQDPHEEDPFDRGLRRAFAGRTPSSQPRDGAVPIDFPQGLLDESSVLLPREDGSVPDQEVNLAPDGRYQVLAEAGRGGLGIVYRGRDRDLDREIALKVLDRRLATDASFVRRFVDEAQVCGRLQHPGIVPVHEIGMDLGDRPYFVMKLIAGRTLAELLAERRDVAEERRRFLDIFERVCQTIAYAHEQRVIHRDLKPSNVMIGAFGEVQVVDWGLAKALTRPEPELAPTTAAAVVATQSNDGSSVGTVVGTPAYMPPEQARGEVDRLDERSDVFALGAMLCEILTGAPVHSRDIAKDVQIEQTARGDFKSALERLRNCGADEALVTLCRCCLSPAAQERPSSAAAVAAVVGDHLTLVEERAHQAELRAAEARYKHRATLLSASAGLLILALGAGAWLWFAHESGVRRDAATERAAVAVADASGLLGEARAHEDGSLERWNQALAAASQAAALANDDDVALESRERAHALLAEVSAAREASAERAALVQRVRTLRSRLEAARIPADENVRVAGWAIKDSRRRDAAYAAAFDEFVGTPGLQAREAERTLTALRRGDLESELAAALDHWAMSRDELAGSNDPPDAEQTSQLRQLARRLDDGDEWRSGLRDVLATSNRNREALERLAATADWTALPATSIVLLGDALWNAGAHAMAVAIYRRGQGHHPADFGLCFTLALHLELLEEPQWEEAITTLRIAEALRPDMLEVLHRRGMALNELDRHQDALSVFEQLAQRDPECSHWRNHIGAELVELGSVDDAIVSFRHAIELDPKDPLPHVSLGNALRIQGKLEESIASYRRAIEVDPSFVLAHVNLGVALTDQGKREESIRSLEHAAQLDPKNVLAQLNLGVSLRAFGDKEGAIAALRRAIELDPRHVAAHSALGTTLDEQGQHAEAITLLRRAITLGPSDPDAHNNLGIALTRQGALDEAIVCYRRALELNPRHASAHNSLGATLEDQGKRAEAIACYRRAIELDPRYAAAFSNLGIALKRQGRLDEAITSYRRAIELDPGLADAFKNLALALESKGALDEAIACLRRAIELGAGNSTAHKDLGSWLWARGALEEATASLRRAIELDPMDAHAHRKLGGVLSVRGEFDEAASCLRRAVELDPADPLAHSNLGSVLASQGAIEDAATQFERAVELDPTLAHAHFWLGNVLFQLGRRDEAIARYERAIALDPSRAASLFDLGQKLRQQDDVEAALACFDCVRAAASLAANDAAAIELLAKADAAIEEIRSLRLRLLQIARGEEPARSPEEWIAAADSAYGQELFALGAQAYTRLFVAHPDLLGTYPHRYNAACDAALAGCGRGQGAAALAEAERTALRAQALHWLRAELAAGGSGANGENASTWLAHWELDGDLAGVREESALLALPESEAEDWRALWREVSARLIGLEARR